MMQASQTQQSYGGESYLSGGFRMKRREGVGLALRPSRTRGMAVVHLLCYAQNHLKRKSCVGTTAMAWQCSPLARRVPQNKGYGESQ